MSDFQTLTELEDAILRYVQSSPSAEQRILKNFTSAIYSKGDVNDHIRSLEKDRGYIKLSESRYLKAGIYSLDYQTTDHDFEYRYKITALGKGYLARSTSTFTSFSNISNSNIAHQSPHAQQSVNINKLPQDIQEKIKELELAVLRKDGSAMKRAYAYMADKSVDVAIAVVTGAMVK